MCSVHNTECVALLEYEIGDSHSGVAEDSSLMEVNAVLTGSSLLRHVPNQISATAELPVIRTFQLITFHPNALTPVLLTSVSMASRIRSFRNIYYIQGVPGGMDKTSGECSLC